jgi:hypothetical protein
LIVRAPGGAHFKFCARRKCRYVTEQASLQNLIYNILLLTGKISELGNSPF